MPFGMAHRKAAPGVRQLASEKGCTPAQLALAWLLTKPDVIPILGTSSVARLEENVRAADVRLTDSDIARIEQALPKGPAAGARYDPMMLDLVDR
jgi:aryl-alcohol dehydrogenase-like predicted oxidoreductase